MQLENKIKVMIYTKGYKSIKSFTDEHELSYLAVLNLANKKKEYIEINLLLNLCEVLDCNISELLELKKDGQVS